MIPYIHVYMDGILIDLKLLAGAYLPIIYLEIAHNVTLSVKFAICYRRTMEWLGNRNNGPNEE